MPLQVTHYHIYRDGTNILLLPLLLYTCHGCYYLLLLELLQLLLLLLPLPPPLYFRCLRPRWKKGALAAPTPTASPPRGGLAASH